MTRSIQYPNSSTAEQGSTYIHHGTTDSVIPESSGHVQALLIQINTEQNLTDRQCSATRLAN